MNHNFTEEQRCAINSIYSHVSLSANAGSGKTSVLVNRFLNIKEQIKDSNIAAITFTKKAASEMMERIALELDKKYYAAIKNNDTNRADTYQYIRRKLSSSKIMTIHSFCTSILRDYPIDAGLDPNFTELDNVQKHFIYKDAIYDTFDEIINNPDGIDKYADSLLTVYNAKSLEEFVRSILSKPDIFDDLKCIYEKSEEEYIEFIKLEYSQFLQNTINDLIALIDENIDNIEWKPENREKVEYLTNKLRHNPQPEYLQELIKIKSKGNTLFINALCKDINAKYLDNLRNILSLNTNSIHIQYHYCKILVQVAADTTEKIQAHKQKIGAIDFDDMLHITRNMLINNLDIAKSIASQFDEIMVDEFQDTNSTQFDIIKRLVPSIDNPTEKTTTNLFIVGDEKQSIYRFRNADVAVFTDAKKRIKRVNPDGDLRLSATFRSLPIITAFINKVCGLLFDGIKNMSGIEYNDLICGKDSEKINQILTNNSTADVQLGSISFLLSVARKKDTSNQTDVEDMQAEDNDMPSEAELVAKHIKHIVANYKKANGEPYIYSDIAVLFRSRSKLSNLTLALLNEGIPFLVTGGSNFFEKSEIYDIIAFLKFLNNQKDDMALLTIMLSPYLDFDKTDIFNICCEIKENVAIYDKLKNYSKQPYATDKIINAYKILEIFCDYAQEVSITHLIRLILKDGKWMNYPSNHIQIHKNIEKFLSIARSFQERSFVTLSDFIEELNILSENSNEGEAADDTNENAVSLLTIHAAKGLEFPVVILYNLNSSKRNSNNTIINKDLGISISIPESIDDMKCVESVANYLIKRKEEQLEYAETLRLLYVAMTRAENHLVLSANFKETKSGLSKFGHLFGLIANSIGLDSETIINYLNSDEAISVFAIPCCIKVYDKNKDIKFNNYLYKIDAKIITKYDESIAMDLKTDTEISNKIKKHCDAVFIQKDKIFSFSAMNEHNEITYSLATNQNKNIMSGSIRGTIFHNVLERINDWFKNLIDKNILLEIIASVVRNLNVGECEYDKDFLIEDLTIITNTQLLQQYKQYLHKAKFEFELNIPVEDNYITGVIDCLIPNENGEFEIWDWKTNHIENTEHWEKLKEYYSQQMKIYIYLLMHFYPNQMKYKARLLFTSLAKPNAADSEWTHTISLTQADSIALNSLIYEQLNNSVYKINL